MKISIEDTYRILEYMDEYVIIEKAILEDDLLTIKIIMSNGYNEIYHIVALAIEAGSTSILSYFLDNHNLNIDMVIICADHVHLNSFILFHERNLINDGTAIYILSKLEKESHDKLLLYILSRYPNLRNIDSIREYLGTNKILP